MDFPVVGPMVRSPATSPSVTSTTSRASVPAVRLGALARPRVRHRAPVLDYRIGLRPRARNGLGAGEDKAFPGRTGAEMDDGDRALERLWPALRKFLRPFCGVGKRCLRRYAADFRAASNLTVSVSGVARLRLGAPATTQITSCVSSAIPARSSDRPSRRPRASTEDRRPPRGTSGSRYR